MFTLIDINLFPANSGIIDWCRNKQLESKSVNGNFTVISNRSTRLKSLKVHFDLLVSCKE